MDKKKLHKLWTKRHLTVHKTDYVYHLQTPLGNWRVLTQGDKIYRTNLLSGKDVICSSVLKALSDCEEELLMKAELTEQFLVKIR